MKFLLTGFLVVALAVALSFQAPHIDAPAETKPCPTLSVENKKKCSCITETSYMVCSGLDENFKLTAAEVPAGVTVNTLVITNSPKLPLLNEKFKPENLIIKSLVIITGTLDPTNSPDNLNEILSLATESLTVHSTADIPIDLSKIKTTLVAISLRHAKPLTGLSSSLLDSFKELKSFELMESSIDPLSPATTVDLTFGSKLERIEISDTAIDSFHYTPDPTACTDKTYINLRNAGLKTFSLSSLFPNVGTPAKPAPCKYHLDLSGNPLNEDVLTAGDLYGNVLKKLAADQLYLILRNVQVKCDTCTLAWYKLHPLYIHSGQCKNEGNKFFDEADSTKVVKNPACPT